MRVVVRRPRSPRFRRRIDDDLRDTANPDNGARGRLPDLLDTRPLVEEEKPVAFGHEDGTHESNPRPLTIQLFVRSPCLDGQALNPTIPAIRRTRQLNRVEGERFDGSTLGRRRCAFNCGNPHGIEERHRLSRPASSVRERTPSLAYTLERFASTVRTLTNSRAAISLLARPAATSSAISRSLVVNSPSLAGRRPGRRAMSAAVLSAHCAAPSSSKRSSASTSAIRA